MKVKLTILSQGAGWTDKVEETAQMNSDGEHVVISYKLNGDYCTLTLTENSLRQERKGSINISLSIERGMKTYCRIGEDGLSGGYDIICKTLNCIIKSFGVNVAASYLSGPDRELIRIKVRAVSIN